MDHFISEISITDGPMKFLFNYEIMQNGIKVGSNLLGKQILENYCQKLCSVEKKKSLISTKNERKRSFLFDSFSTFFRLSKKFLFFRLTKADFWYNNTPIFVTLHLKMCFPLRMSFPIFELFQYFVILL